MPDGNQHIYPRPEIREKWRPNLLGKEKLDEEEVLALYFYRDDDIYGEGSTRLMLCRSGDVVRYHNQAIYSGEEIEAKKE